MRVLIGLSGGLDSAYAAEMLLKAGNEVEGAVLVMHDYTDTKAAEKTAEIIGIPLHKIDCRSIFDKYVVNDFVEKYTHGKTPNPCTVCNRYVKMEMLVKYALENGFDKAATGHYASIKESDGRYCISLSSDPKKDQSYMLWHMTQHQISNIIFPLEKITKEEIKQNFSGGKFDYLTHEKESMEICFIPDNDYASYIEKRLGKTFPEGDFITPDGKVVGRHKGIINYTVGQRKGLGIALGARAYVTEISPEKNTVTVEKEGSVLENGFVCGELNYQKFIPVENEEYTFDVKVRYSYKTSKATTVIRDGKAYVNFETPVRAVTPGQSAVFYLGNDIVFGGIIL